MLYYIMPEVQYDREICQCYANDGDHPIFLQTVLTLVGTSDCMGVTCVNQTTVGYRSYLVEGGNFPNPGPRKLKPIWVDKGLT